MSCGEVGGEDLSVPPDPLRSPAKPECCLSGGRPTSLTKPLVSLGEYIENPDDVTPIEECISPLHRVKGAVEMVGIEGATMLASEMEQLATALAGKKVKHRICYE